MSRVKDLTMTCDPDDDQEVIGGEKFTLATGTSAVTVFMRRDREIHLIQPGM